MAIRLQLEGQVLIYHRFKKSGEEVEKLTPQDVINSFITLNLSESFSERYAQAQPKGIKLTTGIVCENLWLKIRVAHTWSVMICIIHIIHMFEWAAEVNVQLQGSSFITLDGF